MNTLYMGNYYRRYLPICELIKGNVLELCFGDTIIADFCKKNNIQWKGIDINERFVDIARKKGFNAECDSVLSAKAFSVAETCVISGSLYHFHNNLEELFEKMLKCAPVLIISEPVINLGNCNGIIGKLAKSSATINGEKQTFRYTEKSLIDALNLLQLKFNFNYKIVNRFNKDIIIAVNR